MPVLGAIVCLILLLPITGRAPAVYTRAVVLIAIGAALRFVNRMFVRSTRTDQRTDYDAGEMTPSTICTIVFKRMDCSE